jgi:hypothetical protein
MGRYFFHIRDGDRIIEDLEGSELPDLAAAEALKSRGLSSRWRFAAA